jgi:hypothetical protein
MVTKCLSKSEFQINWPPGSGSVIKDYRSSDHGRKDILTDPQHLFSCQEMGLYFFSWIIRLSVCFLNSLLILGLSKEQKRLNLYFWKTVRIAT